MCEWSSSETLWRLAPWTHQSLKLREKKPQRQHNILLEDDAVNVVLHIFIDFHYVHSNKHKERNIYCSEVSL